MMRRPSLNSLRASTPTLGSATTAIGADVPVAGGLWPQAVKARRSRAPLARLALSLALPRRRGRGPDLLITPHLLDSLERDARLAHARHQADLVLLGVFVLGQPRQRLPDRLGVFVVDAD